MNAARRAGAYLAGAAERAGDKGRSHEAHRRHNAERDNVRAALAWAAATPGGAARALDLLAGIPLAPRPSQAEKARRLETLLAAAPARAPARARPILPVLVDFLRRLHHDFAGARVAVEEARAIAAELGAEDLAAHAAARVALADADLGEYAAAVAELERCLALARRHGSWSGVEQFTRDLGGIYLAMGDFPRARAALTESRDVALARGSRNTLRPRLFLTTVDRPTGELRGARVALEALSARRRRAAHAGQP
jgi:hypothetical protein